MKKSTAIALAAFTIACVSAIAALHFSSDDQRTLKTDETRIPLRNNNEAAPKSWPNIERLVSERKISAHAARPEMGRAFSINRSGPMRPSGNALDYAESLFQAAQSGDAVASYDIFLATLDCSNQLRNVGKSYQEIDAGEKSTPMKNTAAEDRKSLLECEGLLTSDKFQKTNWLEKAAQQGSIEAMIMYPINPDHVLGDPQEYAMKPELVQKWKDDSINYLKLAAGLGSTDALYSLSDIYENGVIAPADPVEAYAYRLAAIKSTRAADSQVDQIEFAKNLTDSQREQAKSRSQQIIINCCSH